MKSLRSLCVLTAIMLSATSFAGNKQHGDPHHGHDSPVTSSSGAGASANAGAASTAAANADATQGQGQFQGQTQGQGQTANGGSATGGTASQSQAANNAGNAQNITIQGARQIASLAQGSWSAPECGAGGNAGGSGTGGAGFLGMYWTPADCKLMSIAYTWAHLGMYGEACKTLKATSTLRSAYKKYDLELPDCVALIAALTAPVTEVSTVDPDKYMTKEEGARLFKQAMSK